MEEKIKENETAQATKIPVRHELSVSEINEIVHDIVMVFRKNNLSIRQIRNILSVISKSLEECRPLEE